MCTAFCSDELVHLISHVLRLQEVGSDPDTDMGRAVSLRSYLLIPEIHKDYGDSRPVKVKIGTVKDLKSKPTTTESRNAEEKQ